VLQTQSAEKELARVGPGGLVGLATTLCPRISADDNLQGCVVGRPGTLPPVWDLLTLSGVVRVSDASEHVQTADSEQSEAKAENVMGGTAARPILIEAGREVRLHAGSASVLAIVKKWHTKRGKLVAALRRNLGADLQSSVAIKAKYGETYRLAAHACIADGVQSDILQVADHPCGRQREDTNDTLEGCELADSFEASADFPIDVHDSKLLRERFLDEFLSREGASGTNQGLTIPPPDLSREGGTHCLWKTFLSTVAKLGRPASHFLAFLASEGLPCQRAGETPLCTYTWAQNRKRCLTEELEELRKVHAVPTEEWERCFCITACTGRQIRASGMLEFSKEEFPLKISLKDGMLRIGSRGRGGPVKLSQTLCGFMRLYARTFVICHQCRSASTHLLRDKKLHHTSLELVCARCSARRFMPSRFGLSA